MKQAVERPALEQLFYAARSYNGWLDTPVSDDQLQQLYDILKMGPTSFNCCPGRFVFLRSPEAKDRIRPYLRENNREKTLTAPVAAIIAYDTEFYEEIPKLLPFRPEVREVFAGKDELIKVTAFRNGTLQGAYLMLAARAVGLDCGPMSGFDNQGVDKEFFPDGRFKSNFLCALGQGDPGSIFERLPRFDFDEACTTL